MSDNQTHHESVVRNHRDWGLSNTKSLKLSDVTEHLRSPRWEFVTGHVQELEIWNSLERLWWDDGDAIELEGQGRENWEIEGSDWHLVDVVESEIQVGKCVTLIN